MAVSAQDLANAANDMGFTNNGSSTYGATLQAYNAMNQLDDVLGISQANTAINLDEAQKLRNWQQQMYQVNMDYNATEAAKNRSWQEYMSNTAHQREVHDLIAAGLNPVLSASGGQGAATTSGATASVGMPSGAKGEADTSGSSAVVGLLGHALSSITNIATQNMNARVNESIANKYNAFNQYIAELNAENQREVAHIHGQYGLQQTEIAGRYGLAGSQAMAGATSYAAQLNAAAQQYAADQATLRTQLDLAHDSWVKENYPTTMYGAIASALGGIPNLKGLFNEFATFTNIEGMTTNAVTGAFKSWLQKNGFINSGFGSGSGSNKNKNRGTK